MSLKLPSKKVALPGGGKFVDPGSGMHFPPEGGVYYAWDQLLSAVSKHRAATGGDLDVGWEIRLEHDFCCQHPEAGCMHHVPSKDLDINLGDLKRFGYSVFSFIKNGGKCVPQEEAERRARICMQCPYRVHDALCKSCNGMADFFTENFLNKTTPYDSELGNCGVCKCYNKVAVHWPLESQSTEGLSKEDFPEYCWKRGA